MATTTKTLPFDPAKHLTDPVDQADLLNDALATGNTAYIANALGTIARARGMSGVARGAGVTREALYKSLNKKGDPNLTGQIKLGGWCHFENFADERFASNGVSLAAPAGSGAPLPLSGDVGGWAVFEQQIYRVPHSDDRGIGIFARVSGAPADRNLIDLYADAGLEFIGLGDARPDDKIGIATGYAHVSKRAQALDADYRALVRPDWPTRSFEGLLTAVYQYLIRDGWTVQPNFQYIIHPGGGATLPSGLLAGKALGNASVFGLRTTLKF